MNPDLVIARCEVCAHCKTYRRDDPGRLVRLGWRIDGESKVCPACVKHEEAS